MWAKCSLIDHSLLKVGRAVDMYLVLVDRRRCRCLSDHSVVRNVERDVGKRSTRVISAVEGIFNAAE